MVTKHQKITMAIVALTVIVVITGCLFLFRDSACGKNTIFGGVDKCYGVIALRQDWDTKYYELYDNTHHYQLVGIDNPGQLVIADGDIYVINKYPQPSIGTYTDGRKEYSLYLFQGREMTLSNYDKESDVPTYLVIEYKTGEVKIYKDIDEVPEAQKSYFTNLKNK